MHNHVTIVQNEPAFLCLSLDASFFLVFLLGSFQHTFGECIQHPVTGTVTNHEIISK